jgi:hypothetical protein
VSRKLAILVGRVEVGPPASASGVRVVALPAVAVEALRKHMGDGGYVDEGPDATSEWDREIADSMNRRIVRPIGDAQPTREARRDGPPTADSAS